MKEQEIKKHLEKIEDIILLFVGITISFLALIMALILDAELISKFFSIILIVYLFWFAIIWGKK